MSVTREEKVEAYGTRRCDFLPSTLSDVVWHGLVPAENCRRAYRRRLSILHGARWCQQNVRKREVVLILPGRCGEKSVCQSVEAEARPTVTDHGNGIRCRCRLPWRHAKLCQRVAKATRRWGSSPSNGALCVSDSNARTGVRLRCAVSVSRRER